jgi:hypothetical protein
MIPLRSLSLKKIALHILFIACCLLTVYLSFVSLISVWIGLGYAYHPGSWVPILAGTTSLILVLWAFLRIIRYLLGQMKEDDVVNI